MKINKKTTGNDHRKDKSARLAGVYGSYAAKQDAEALLRRSVMANLLWENCFYEDGQSVADNITNLIPQIDPQVVFDIAVEARTKQKLRHVPLLIAREMARISTHKSLVGKLLPQIILRADELSEFVSIYWKDGRQPLSNQIKLGLSKAFEKFNEYQLAKYNQNKKVKLRDVLFLVHPKPDSPEREDLYNRLANNKLNVPDTWEVSLSAGKDKKETWIRLIEENKLGALAFVRNLCIDPFSNKNKLATITNDIDNSFNTDYNLDALDFMKIHKDNSIDVLLLDPPYSPRQISECYKKMNLSVNIQTTQASFWSNLKKEAGRIIKPNGYAITFAWNSGGIGKKYGFEIIEILLVAHGGWHNDTIVTVEKKIS